MPILPPEESLQALQSFAGWVWGRVPEKSFTMAVAWRRDGLGACFARLEQLKLEAAQVTYLLEETHRRLGEARRQRAQWKAAMDDKMAEGVEARAQAMSTRGMAAEERWLSHRSRALVEFGWLRKFDDVEIELAAVKETLQTRSFAIRDESMAIQAQFRAINVGIEISEL